MHTSEPRARLLRTLRALLLLLVPSLGLHAQTATNNCGYFAGNQYTVAYNTCGFQTFNKGGTFTQAVNPTTCNATNHNDAWGWFTAVNTITTITYDPDNFHRPVMHVYTGACGALTQVACNDAGADGANAEVTLNTVVGTNYLVRIIRRGTNAAMNGRLCVRSPQSTNACSATAAAPYPVGTACTPTPFQKPASYTASGNPGGCTAGNFADGWGRFIATGTTTVIAFSPDQAVRPILHVFTGTCAALTQVGCHNSGAAGATAELVLTTVVGQTYFFRLQVHNENTAMSGGLCIWNPNTTNGCAFDAQNQWPVTATCEPRPFQKPTAYTFTSNPGTCGSGNYDDAWAWFTATATSTAITFDPDLAHRPVMHAFSGTCGTLTQVACHDAGANGADAHVTIPTVPGQNYAVRIQRSLSNAEMNGTLCVWNPPPSDECGGAIVLPVLETCFMQNFTNAHAGRSTTTPNPSCGGTLANNTLYDMWFRFTAPASGVVIIETAAGTLNNAVMQLYRGSCNALIALQCDDTSGPGNMPRIDRRCNPLDPFATYWIRLWGRNGLRGSFNICVRGFDVFPVPQEDCGGGATVCGNQQISNTTDWRGCTADLNTGNRGCLVSNERQGTWYYFSPQTTGTIGMTIRPVDQFGNPANVDYDFAIWGPMTNITCPPAGTPLRCSYAYPPSAGTWLTGMAAGNTDTSEPASGTNVNGFVAPLNITAAQVGLIYLLYIDNFTSNGQSFQLEWALSTPDMLDCTVLPVDLVAFEAKAVKRTVEVRWTTADEDGLSHFVVERSADGRVFAPVAQVGAAGLGFTMHHYLWVDHAPLPGTSQYRLRMVDHDGSEALSLPATVHLQEPGERSLQPRPNPTEHRFTVDLPSLGEVPLVLKLTDASGRTVMSTPVMPGTPFITLHVAHLQAGSYVLLLEGTDGTPIASGRLLKQ
jgi:hypothetical protein